MAKVMEFMAVIKLQMTMPFLLLGDSICCLHGCTLMMQAVMWQGPGAVELGDLQWTDRQDMKFSAQQQIWMQPTTLSDHGLLPSYVFRWDSSSDEILAEPLNCSLLIGCEVEGQLSHVRFLYPQKLWGNECVLFCSNG